MEHLFNEINPKYQGLVKRHELDFINGIEKGQCTSDGRPYKPYTMRSRFLTQYLEDQDYALGEEYNPVTRRSEFVIKHAWDDSIMCVVDDDDVSLVFTTGN